MNNKILAVVVMLVLLAVLFAGCNESEEDKFKGTWEGGFAEYSTDMGITKLIFSSGNKVACVVKMKVFEGDYREVDAFDGTYRVEEDNLIIKNSLGGTYIYTYRFEGDYLILDEEKFSKS